MKNKWIALGLCIGGSLLGLHHYYLGNWKKGVLFFLTAGGIGIWWVYDMIMLICSKSYIENYKTATSFKEGFKADIVHREKLNQIKRENIVYRANSQVGCPKCGSTQLTANKKGFSLGKALVGGLVLVPIAGVATGMIGKNKILITCLSCGKQFKPGR